MHKMMRNGAFTFVAWDTSVFDIPDVFWECCFSFFKIFVKIYIMSRIFELAGIHNKADAAICVNVIFIDRNSGTGNNFSEGIYRLQVIYFC